MESQVCKWLHLQAEQISILSSSLTNNGKNAKLFFILFLFCFIFIFYKKQDLRSYLFGEQIT